LYLPSIVEIQLKCAQSWWYASMDVDTDLFLRLLEGASAGKVAQTQITQSVILTASLSAMTHIIMLYLQLLRSGRVFDCEEMTCLELCGMWERYTLMLATMWASSSVSIIMSS
jgi:hypothetical protein